MSKAKHTPGPWEALPPVNVDNNGNLIPIDLFAPEYWFIDGPGADGHMTYADARLIAAAPDLLEALTRLVDIEDGNSIGVFGWDAVMDAARAAIAKATGGAA